MNRAWDHDLPDTASCAPLPPETRALVADPAHFDVKWVINPHMQLGSVDTDRARGQWQSLVDALSAAGMRVEVVPPVEGLCDLVFTANQSLPLRDGTGRVLLARMMAAVRQPEVAVVGSHWESLGFTPCELPGLAVFEAGGDALWVPGRRAMVCGHGYRTERPALDALAEAAELPVLALKLVDPRFYHLDTCLLPLDEGCALYVADAFHEADRARIRALFPDAVAVPEAEAMNFACNGAVVNGHFLVHRGSPEACAVARDRGLQVVELDTSEFLKSGGSVTCMHLRF